MSKNRVVIDLGGGGITIGNILAGYLSWITWHSIGWMIINGLFGWLYVIYWLCNYWHGG
jgi:hypothetical protein